MKITSITQLAALVLGAAVSISALAEPWTCDFKQTLDSRYWTPTIVGNSSFAFTTISNGLQVAGPSGGSGFQAGRLLLNLDNFPGGLTDFEATVTFEGAVFNDSWRHQVQMELGFPGQYIAVVKNFADVHVYRDPPASEAGNTTAGADSGTMRVVRSGATIAAYWNNGSTPLWSGNYGTAPLTYFALALNKNSSSVATAVTWQSFSITPAPVIAPTVITITSNTTLGVDDGTYEAQRIVVDGCTLTVNGPHSFASLLLTNSAVLTHSPAPNGETNNRLQLTIADDCVIASDSAINVVGRGYAQTLGPGAGPATSSAGVGAGYGGLGGAGTGWLRTGGGVYGSLFAPMDFGSGGGRLVNHSEGTGSSGGGAVFLSVAGTLTVEGVINASGADINHWTQHLGGAGSGGSIYLVAASLAGNGSIVADGGNVAQSSSYSGGGGGGGRVALHLQTNTFTGNCSTKGGLGSPRTGEGAQSGGAGTVCLLSADQPAVVTIHNGGRNGMGTLLNYTQWPTNWQFRLEAAGNAVVYPAAPLTLAGLLVTNGAVLTHSPASNGEANNRLQLTITGDCVIASNGLINVVGCGYAQALGPGAGPATSSAGVGAGHGGMGGAGTGWLRTGGAIYGSLFAPMDFGSGGGRLVNHSEGTGSSGGGAVFLSVAGTLTLEGGINASGADINHWTQSLGGAGSGGSIYLVALSLTGSGSIVADGGNVAQSSSYSGGGGGGGRIAVRFDTNTFSGVLSAKGGRGSPRTGEGAQSGGAGTICLQSAATPTATVWINNGGNSGNSSGLTRLNPNQWPVGDVFDLVVCSNAVLYPDQPLTFASLNVTSGARLGHAPMDRNLVLTVLGNALLDASSSITADGCGYPEASGPGAGGSSSVYYGSGAGHGGVGGWSAAGGGGPGGIYDSYFAPADFGSGGGRSWGGHPGGPGGGAVRLTVGGEFRMDGIISVKGQRTPSDNGGGGGSGGSVYLTTSTLLGEGFISVRGGDGGAGVGGGGAGGRVAIYHQGIAGGITNQIDRMGGASVQGQSGGLGTLYITNQYLPLEVLTHAPTGTLRQAVSSVDVAFNQSVRSETFTPDDVLITAPSGEPPHGDITVTPLSASSFRIGLGSHAALGTYLIQVGPHIENLYGQEMAAAYVGSFTITNPVIAGVVRQAGGQPLTGVVLSGDGLSTTTDAAGAYFLSTPPGWTGTLAASLGGWVFTPPSRAYVTLSADATNENYTATLAHPLVLEVTAGPGALGLSWPSAVGLNYQLQTTTNLNPAVWLDAGLAFPGTGGVLSTNVPLGSEPANFFRVQSGN